MSNKSEKYPEGYLDKETLKSFFAVSGDSGNFTYSPGHERIPDNWYKTAVGAEYTIAVRTPNYQAQLLYAHFWVAVLLSRRTQSWH